MTPVCGAFASRTPGRCPARRPCAVWTDQRRCRGSDAPAYGAVRSLLGAVCAAAARSTPRSLSISHTDLCPLIVMAGTDRTQVRSVRCLIKVTPAKCRLSAWLFRNPVVRQGRALGGPGLSGPRPGAVSRMHLRALGGGGGTACTGWRGVFLVRILPRRRGGAPPTGVDRRPPGLGSASSAGA